MLNSIKKIMDGLSAQYADDFLSSADKERVLNNRPVEQRVIVSSQPDMLDSVMVNDGKRHIALLCNDSTNQSVLSYILGNSGDYSVDVLYHGMHKSTANESFYKQARSSFVENNVDVRLVKLINDSVNEVKNYLLNHRSLQYLVTDSNDLLINEFLKNQSIQRQVNVPIVLVN